MGNEVFANGNEIACKSGDGKVIAAFPDVCLSPPSPPAGPVPVPYPDTSFSKDMKNGSKTVKIDDKEVMLKDKSFYKTSPLGNEAATKSLGAGVVSHVITGKTYFVAWSMDVKFEGKNVDRHIDLTTSNHASPMGNEGAPWANVAKMKIDDYSCKKIVAKIHEYSDKDCPNGMQSHHIIDNSCFTMRGARSTPLSYIEGGNKKGRRVRNLFETNSTHPGKNYDECTAPCICLKGSKSNPKTQHGIAHAVSKDIAKERCSEGKWKYSDAREAGKKSIKKALKIKDWEADCIEKVLDSYYKDKLGCVDKTEIVAPTGKDFAANYFDNGRGKKSVAYILEWHP